MAAATFPPPISADRPANTPESLAPDRGTEAALLPPMAHPDRADLPISFEHLPRERLQRLGPEALSPDELFSLILGTRPDRAQPTLEALRHLLEAGCLDDTCLEELAQVPRLGMAKAARIAAAIELGRRIVAQPLPKGMPLRSSRLVAAALRPRLGKARIEHFVAIALDAKNRPFGEYQIAQGGRCGCPAEPADVFRPLLRSGALATVLVHNHPSGDPTPSPEDCELTKRLYFAGELLGIQVLDHVILGSDGHFSFLDAHLLPPESPPCP